jgi:glycosyltransferase involved in cell wall biosynthesis
LLRAFSLVVKKIDAKLLIIGKGKLKNYLQDFVLNNNLSDHVKLLGYNKNPYNFIKTADIFILSSKFEGLPNVLLEAQFLKKYIISTDCPTGPKEILLNGKAGDLFPVGDYVKLSKIILNYNYQSQKIKKKINLGLKKFYRFDMNKNCLKYLNILNKYI